MKTVRLVSVLCFLLAVLCALCFAAAEDVILPGALTEIGDRAFYGDTSLGSVVIPEGTTYIGHLAFAGSSVTEITLPDTVEEIEPDAFSDCAGLVRVNASREFIARQDIGTLFSDTPWLVASGDCLFDSQWYLLGDGTLYVKGSGTLYLSYSEPAWQAYRDSISCVYIAQGIENIDGPLFEGCSNISECIFPEGLKSIQRDTFRYCTGLTQVRFPSTMETVGPYAFYGCSGLESVSFNDGLREIGEYAFGFNTSLQALSLPRGLTTIHPLAVNAADNIAAFTVHPENAHYVSQDGVLYTSDGKTLVLYPRALTGPFDIPDGVEVVGPYAFAETRITGVSFPDSVTSIEERAFSYCRNIRNITVGSNVAGIGQSAFEVCSSLVSITLPASLESIEHDIFASCYDLAEIVVDADNPSYCSENGLLLTKDGTRLLFCPLGYTGVFVCPSGLIEIGEGAFRECRRITGVVLPEELKIIGEGAFNQCSVPSIDLPESLEQIGEYAFADSGLTSVTIPKNARTGNFAFSSCRMLESVEFEEGFRVISYGAFEYCSALGAVVIPSSVVSIEHAAFSQCSSLGEIVVSGANAHYSSLDGVLFDKAQTTLIQYPSGQNQTEYTVPSSVDTIKGFAFYYCDSLQRIVIPPSVTEIGILAIDGCDNLSQILYTGTQAQWDGIFWNNEGNWIVGYDPQEFIDYMNSIVVFGR